MVDKIEKYIKDELKSNLYASPIGAQLIKNVYNLYAKAYRIMKDQKGINLPIGQLIMIDKPSVGALVTKLEEKYWIFVNKGVIEEQETYLRQLDWRALIENEQISQYIGELIEYGFYFIVFHEYAHILCGHIDAKLVSAEEKQAQECEADIFAMKYLVHNLEGEGDISDYVEEIEKIFFAVYFIFEKMQKQNSIECYNDKIFQNYYEEERISMRDHPLDAQRIIYLYEMLKILIIGSSGLVQMIDIREDILHKMCSIKDKDISEIPRHIFQYYAVEESINKIKDSVIELRKKIPRID